MNSPSRNDYEHFKNSNHMPNENDTYCNYQINLENNIELQKAIAKLEDLLSKKHVENENLIQMHNDFKELHEKIRKECIDLNKKLLTEYNEKNMREKKYQAETEKLKNHFEKQKEIYETQICKLASQDTETLKHKITAEIELKQKYFINQKDIEIQTNHEQIFELRRKYELKATELEAFVNESVKEKEILKENHKNEVREFLFKIQLLNEKCESNVDKETFRNMKYEIESYRKNFNDLQNEVVQLRKEKEYLILEKNDTKIKLLKELDEEKLKSKIVQNEIEKNSMTLKNFENEVVSLRSKLEEKNNDAKFLTNEKFENLKEIRLKETELESTKSEIRMCRQKLETREKECESLVNFAHEKEKQRFINEKTEKEEYQKKIEELQKSLRENQIEFKNYYENSNEELHTAKRDFYMISEEKRNLIGRISDLQEEIGSIKEENLKKNKAIEFYEKENKNLEEECRNISMRENENSKLKISSENELIKKSQEVDNLNSLMKIYEKEKKEAIGEIKSEYRSKIKNLLLKKTYYKNQVRL